MVFKDLIPERPVASETLLITLSLQVLESTLHLGKSSPTCWKWKSSGMITGTWKLNSSSLVFDSVNTWSKFLQRKCEHFNTLQRIAIVNSLKDSYILAHRKKQNKENSIETHCSVRFSLAFPSPTNVLMDISESLALPKLLQFHSEFTLLESWRHWLTWANCTLTCQKMYSLNMIIIENQKEGSMT